MERKEGIELLMMHGIGLRVDLPDEGTSRPLRAHEGVLAAHEVEIARPEQPIVAILIREGEYMDIQTTAPDMRACFWSRATQPGCDIRQNT